MITTTSTDGKTFPIQTATACRLKWSWSSVLLTDGTTGSCHRASYADLTPENFDNFHNLPNKQADRKTMLEGKWPGAGCEYCRDIELAGGLSDRQFQLQIPNVYPQELDIDHNIVKVNPVILEIFFNKTCNLGCLYCTEKLSSTIEKENQKFGRIAVLEDRGVQEKNKYEELAPLMWDWLEKNFLHLKRLQILGGEPLLQPDFDRLLDFIENNPNPALELNFVTNLIIKPQHLTNCLEKLKKLLAKRKIKQVDILASVDSWGPVQEYVRWGFNRNVFDENIRNLLSYKSIRAGLLSTVNSLSIHEMPYLAEKVRDWTTIRPFYWYPHLILPIDQHVMSPCYFAYETWQPSFESVFQLLADDTKEQQQTRSLLDGIASKLKVCTSNPKSKQSLIEYLDEMDRRRSQDWRSLLPWLAKDLANVV